MDEFKSLADFNFDGKVDNFERAMLFHMMEEEDREIGRTINGGLFEDMDDDFDDHDDFEE